MGEGDYKVGDKAFYHDTGEVNEVEVLENNSNDESLKYRLKVLKVVHESSMVKPSKVGHEFDCDKVRGVSVAGLWHLLNHS